MGFLSFSLDLPQSMSRLWIPGGLQLGFNWQWGSAVAGFEIDYTFTDAGDRKALNGNRQFVNSGIDA